MDIRTKFKAFLLIACWVLPVSASASDVGEGFKSFILGSEARAAAHPQNNGLDPISKACLSCHDGAQAKSVNITNADVSPGRRFDRRNHPVGIDYVQAVSNNPHGLKTSASLHPAIQLVDGKISCVSCHRPKPSAQTTPTATTTQLASQTCTASKDYTLGPSDKALCLACHISESP